MGFGGAALKILQTCLYGIEFCCAGIILGLYSYFLSVLADRNIPIPQWEKAVEGISGAAVLYTIFAVLLTVCLGGKTLFAFIGIVLDLLFCAAFIAVAVLTRHGSSRCTGNVNTPLGSGDSHSKQGFGGNAGQGDRAVYSASLGTICRMNSACFAVAIAGAVLFLVSALLQFALGRHHQKEKRYGPGPSNGYTAGSGGKFWKRGRKNQRPMGTHTRDPEMAAPAAAGGLTAGTAGAHDYRPSHDTAYTGSTVAPQSGYENPNKPVHSGYHTAPTGTYAAPTGTYNANTATNY